MKYFLLIFFAFEAFAASWVDENGIEWLMPSGKASHASAYRKCARSGYRLPSAEAFWEAIDQGLLAPEVNTAFGEKTKSLDWIWIRGSTGTPSFAWMASRWEDMAGEEVSVRHWVLCARKVLS